MQSRLGMFVGDDAGFFTVGYERLSLEELFLLLKDAGVECLVDVRQAPWSRVPEFSKPVMKRISGNTAVGIVIQ